MLTPGTTLLRYVVETPIGRGGMGSVYRARDTHLDRAVALKVLLDGAGGLPDKEARERLVREARAAAALSHPNAVAIYDAGDSDHGPFIVMELVEGETLRAAMERGTNVSDVLGWMKMAALALGEAHERGIVHRDIKPENLMLRRDGIAKVLDFGIARQGASSQDASAPTHAALPTLTGTGVQVGTPQYMAPEQIKGKKLDGRADQFSWAVTAYEALTGALPWQASNGALGVVASILEEVPPPVMSLRAEVPEHVSKAIARAMEKRIEDRFASMRDLVAALEGHEVAPDAGGPKKLSIPAPPTPHEPRPASFKPETRFGEGTVKAVIGKALALEEQGTYSKGDLRDAARELGITEDALEEAARAIRADKQRSALARSEEPLRQRILEQRRRGFQKHLVAYIGVNIIILLPGLMEAQRDLWAFFIPAISWGIGLAIHALSAFSKNVTTEQLRRAREREDHAIAKDASRRAALAASLEKYARKRGGDAAVGHSAAILRDAAMRIRSEHELAPRSEDRVRISQEERSSHDDAARRAAEEAHRIEAEVEAERQADSEAIRRARR